MGDHSFAPMNSSDFSTALAGDSPQQELHPTSVRAAPGLRFSVFCLLSAANGFLGGRVSGSFHRLGLFFPSPAGRSERRI